ncbi:peptidoglycan/xylan/chitin deacetylase (PgdA/CDA1 family) [Kribbella orskensis]|uniref:Peptidoglycan/xylan/chitin deacetylase (PgdA/CDA1 family) n=1 Tax=Kribbella orskensis TaxID=2512216 RepID=A0ABY2BVU1_9ACTN|nr:MULTISPECIES: polysaccharide deacetylase family protein [Kribbella]TCN44518.1 peptidoglycan/xylan/chitin deacetylase (PgdA/CDA1 family) [Kribbella sp. VKM Ac-2500]TCO31704.1 peptidoglycan/xylan/chitin deacetylase (PgdA/CDA1 family) [Kribbella orskensis]
MTLPPGRLLLVAAVLFGAALAQAAKPSSDHATAGPVVHADVRPAANHGPLAVVPEGRRTTPPARRTGQTSHPVTHQGNAQPHGTVPPSGKVLYLTFDDGPQREWTPRVLSLLAKHQAKATFFVLGREAAAHPDLVALEKRLGHHVGNHTWDHPMLTHLPPAEIQQEISSGVPSKCFRPPYRDTNAHVAAVAASYHQRQVLWDVDTLDWEKPGTAKIERAILQGARPGAIILLHDGGGNRAQTVAALDHALTKLTAQGYTYQALGC